MDDLLDPSLNSVWVRLVRIVYSSFQGSCVSKARPLSVKFQDLNLCPPELMWSKRSKHVSSHFTLMGKYLLQMPSMGLVPEVSFSEGKNERIIMFVAFHKEPCMAPRHQPSIIPVPEQRWQRNHH